MSALHARAQELGSISLQVYLGQRTTWLREQKSDMLKGFAAISQLAGILEQVPLLSDTRSIEEGVSG